MLSTLRNTKGFGRLMTTGLRLSKLKLMMPIRKLATSSSKKPVIKIQMKIVPASVPLDQNYDDRNMRKGRLLSPHLGVYKPQLTSVLSILLRISGCVLTVYVWMIGMLGLFCADNIKEFFERNEELDCGCSQLTLGRVVFAFPFAYHILHGTRHLIWYTGAFLTKPNIYATGYLSIALTFALTAALASIHGDGKDKNEPEILLPDKKTKLKVKKQSFDRSQFEMTLTELNMKVDEEAPHILENDT